LKVGAGAVEGAAFAPGDCAMAGCVISAAAAMARAVNLFIETSRKIRANENRAASLRPGS
jgi:hypothetical protein